MKIVTEIKILEHPDDRPPELIHCRSGNTRYQIEREHIVVRRFVDVHGNLALVGISREAESNLMFLVGVGKARWEQINDEVRQYYRSLAATEVARDNLRKKNMALHKELMQAGRERNRLHEELMRVARERNRMQQEMIRIQKLGFFAKIRWAMRNPRPKNWRAK